MKRNHAGLLWELFDLGIGWLMGHHGYIRLGEPVELKEIIDREVDGILGVQRG